MPRSNEQDVLRWFKNIPTIIKHLAAFNRALYAQQHGLKFVYVYESPAFPGLQRRYGYTKLMQIWNGTHIDEYDDMDYEYRRLVILRFNLASLLNNLIKAQEMYSEAKTFYTTFHSWHFHDFDQLHDEVNFIIVNRSKKTYSAYELLNIYNDALQSGGNPPPYPLENN